MDRIALLFPHIGLFRLNFSLVFLCLSILIGGIPFFPQSGTLKVIVKREEKRRDNYTTTIYCCIPPLVIRSLWPTIAHSLPLHLSLLYFIFIHVNSQFVLTLVQLLLSSLFYGQSARSFRLFYEKTSKMDRDTNATIYFFTQTSCFFFFVKCEYHSFQFNSNCSFTSETNRKLVESSGTLPSRYSNCISINY